MAKYTRPNLSEHAALHTGGFFRILASMAETFVFIYIGTSLCLERQVSHPHMFLRKKLALRCLLTL
jgi:sodium/hydrogen exchanger 8